LHSARIVPAGQPRAVDAVAQLRCAAVIVALQNIDMFAGTRP
jgi:hypothetical protein